MPVAVVADETSLPALPRCIVVIPARYASSRFPGKPLARIAGRTMIEHVYRRAAAARSAAAVIVATDDLRVAEAVQAFGGDVRMTRASHRSGTERLAEVAESLACDLVVNVQGDEPLIDPRMIDEAVAPLAADPTLPMGTLRRAIDDDAELASPHVVKVVVDCSDRALYFSRAAIPRRRDPGGPMTAGTFKHIGLYVYRRRLSPDARRTAADPARGGARCWSSCARSSTAIASSQLRPASIPSAWTRRTTSIGCARWSSASAPQHPRGR